MSYIPSIEAVFIISNLVGPETYGEIVDWERMLGWTVIPVDCDAISGLLFPMSYVRQITGKIRT